MRRYACKGRWPLTKLAIFVVCLAPLHGAGPDYRLIADKAVVDGPTHDGVEIQIDLPASQHVRNFGAPADDKGLCVFASMTMAGRWHNVPELFDIIHKINEGGGWPGKVDEVLKKYAPSLKYVQEEGDAAKLAPILDKALAEGHIVCATYGYGERYEMKTIYHMVCLNHFDGKLSAVLDNNFPGTYEWAARDEFLRRLVHPSGNGWIIIFLAPPPPPVPHN